MIIYIQMNSINEDIPQTNNKKSFWHYIINFKVALNAFIVWFVLFCYNMYGYIFGWIQKSNHLTAIFYVKRFAVLFILYFFFLLINFLIKLPAFKTLYHKKVAYIVLAVWSVLNLTCCAQLYFIYLISFKVYALKLLHLFCIYFLALTITKLIQRFHETKIKHQLILAGIFCVIGWLFLLLTYPGTWNCDDILILDAAATYELLPWHHLFTSIYHVLCLQTIPFVFSVVFFQVLLNALMFSYCVTTLADIFTKTSQQKLILEIILSVLFIFPPVLFHTLGGFRMGIYQFLELYLLTKLISLYYYKDKKITWLKLIEITILTFIVGTWRTECFFYPIITFVVMFSLGKERIKRLTAFIMSIISFVSIIAVYKINTKFIYSNNYVICSTLPIVCKILLEVDDLDENTVNILDKIVYVEKVKADPNQPLQKYFWIDCVRSEYSQTEYKDYIKTTLKLYFKYPEKAFNYLSDNLKRTLIGDRLTMQLENSIHAFSNPKYHNYWYYFDSITDSYLHKPINTKFRNNIINWFNGFSVNQDFVYPYYKITPLYSLFYNLAIPLCLFIISIIIILVCRRWFLLIPCMAILCHAIIVFFTAPEYYFFYYLSVYLFMYVFSTTIIFNAITSLIKKIQAKNKLKIK